MVASEELWTAHVSAEVCTLLVKTSLPAHLSPRSSVSSNKDLGSFEVHSASFISFSQLEPVVTEHHYQFWYL